MVSAVHVDSALAYYAEYSDEVDRELDANRAAAAEAEAAWNRMRDALAR